MGLPRPGRLATALGAGLLAATVLHHLGRRRAGRAVLATVGPTGDPSGPRLPSPLGPVDADPTTREPASWGFRPDVEGLRGVAIVLVLAFHSALAAPGGFIGVDVFFVISGFLITGMLVREAERTGTISLARFFARRFRRLLPAAAVALAVTLPLAYLVVAPLDRPAAMMDGAAAVASISNVRFALVGDDYFAAVTGPSPFLHFWSLSVEEQFYLAWPLLLLLVARGRHARRLGGLALVAVLGLSLAASVAVTESSALWAFYSLPCRAWQFAAGGVLAVAAPLVSRVPGALLESGGWAAALALVASAMLLDGGIAYPGVVALVPTVAAVALIASGEQGRGPGLLLRRGPARFLGRISYSLYLWHWPIIVLPAIATGTALQPPVAVALVATSIVVGWFSWSQVERRFYRPGGETRPAAWRPLALSGVTIALVAALAGGLASVAIADVGPSSDGTAEAALVDAGDLGPVALADPAPPSQESVGRRELDGEATGTTGSATAPRPSPSHDRTGDVVSADPSPGPAPTTTSPRPNPTPAWTLRVPETVPAGPIPLPRDVEPSLAAARSDVERLFADGCITQTSGTRPAGCTYGSKDGPVTVALVGDSHASQWFPAFNVLANRHGWRLLPYVKVACPFVDMPVYNLRIKREYTECATWRDRVVATLDQVRPDLVVVVSGYRAIIAARDSDASPARQGAAMGRAVATIEAPVAILIDNPRAGFDIPGCLSGHRDDVRACAIPRGQAFPPEYGQRETIAAAVAGARLVDLVGAVCPSTPCQVVRDGRILYRDNHHLTATFVRSLADPLDAALGPLLRSAADGPRPDEPRG